MRVLFIRYARVRALALPLWLGWLVISGCDNNYVPKPRGYFRIDLPEKEYVRFESEYPYSFAYPTVCRLVPDTGHNSEPFWLDMDYPLFGAKIHLSYKRVHHDLNRYLEDTRSMLMKHIPKANAIKEKQYINAENDVFGVIYFIEGTSAASPVQFYATDSVKHFLRGALYFDAVPNNDSLEPVISFISEDIQNLIATLRWDVPLQSSK
ncbi:MAG: gliding motility lipoprotein GldD [Bacteroidales bacterium]|nr:gliding motility lipoprotein GldD [Bacteroidales bacterium]